MNRGNPKIYEGKKKNKSRVNESADKCRKRKRLISSKDKTRWDTYQNQGLNQHSSVQNPTAFTSDAHVVCSQLLSYKLHTWLFIFFSQISCSF